MTGLLHPFPSGTPTDAALAAQRDADHAREIAEWEARMRCVDCGKPCPSSIGRPRRCGGAS